MRITLLVRKIEQKCSSALMILTSSDAAENYWLEVWVLPGGSFWLDDVDDSVV